MSPSIVSSLPMRTALSVFSPIAPAVSLVSAASLALAPSFSISSVGTVPVPLGVSIPPLLNLIPLLPRLPSQLSRTPPTKSDLHLPLLPHSILDIDKGELKGLRSRSLSVSLASEPGTRLVADPVDDFGGCAPAQRISVRLVVLQVDLGVS